MNSLITDAVRERRVLTFTYDGFERQVEPYTYGKLTTGYEGLRAFQTGGGSRSGNQPMWRLFHVNRIRGLALTEDRFTNPRPDYNPQDSDFRTIWAGV
ncbi:MAG: WYL domain-containing protein [Deltaproteobacteria bacterium]|nr:WYL domain-containing protein [Deltaproteobacteria bacterium]